MIIYADLKLRVYRDRTEWKVCDANDIKFCCEPMEGNFSEGFSMDSYSGEKGDERTSLINMHIKGGDDYYSGEYTNESKVDFCPWCSEKITIEVRHKDKVPYNECTDCNAVFKACETEEHMMGHYNDEIEIKVRNYRAEAKKKIAEIKTKPVDIDNIIDKSRCICKGFIIKDECFMHGINRYE
jgi:hypothetical protein